MTTATTTPAAATGRLRPRRSCLAVPGSSPRFLEKAQGLPADQVFLDLEDACAPLVKESARHVIVDVLNHGDWGGKTRVVRVNDWTTHWTYRDVITVVEGAGPSLDCLMLPKVQDAGQVTALDLLLTQIEKTMGLPVGRIGIEAQIENARGLLNVDAIAAASPRLETIIFGPADFMASINMKSLVVGEQPPGYPADAYHYILMRILIAARAHDLQAIDGPYLQIRNVDGYRAVARRAAALGFDGKWVLHPDQIAAANEIFSPSQEDYDHAELILDAYDWCTSQAGGAKGSAMLGEEMIDEASRKMALVIAAKGRAAEDGHRVRRPPVLPAHHEPPPAPPGRELRRAGHRLRPERGGGQLHLFAAARHVGPGRLGPGHREPGGRVAQARGADLPRRHHLRPDHRARQAAHVQARPGHRPGRDPWLQAGRHPGLRVPPQGDGPDPDLHQRARRGTARPP